MQHVVLGATEWQALGVGLVTGALYTWLRLPIPAPNVLGGILAIIGTFVGLVIVGLMRGTLVLG